MSGAQILLVAAVVVIPLAIAVAVTLWTLEPAAQRAERAKRGPKRAQAAGNARQSTLNVPKIEHVANETAERDVRTPDPH